MTPALAPETLLAQLRWRYATKRFDPTRTIAPEIWRTLEDALVLTPSSYGLQPWHFLVITDRALRARLRPLTWDQPQVTDCSHLVVFAIRRHLQAADVDRFIALTARIRNVPPAALASYRDMMLGDVIHGPRSWDVNHWAARQAYIALGNFMISAALLGIDTCPIEGFEPARYDQVLELPQRGLAATVVCAAGYRAADDPYAGLPKVRFPREEVIEHRI